MRIEEHAGCSSHQPPLVLTIKRKEQTMTAKEMILYDNTTEMNNALADIRTNVEIGQFFRPQMVALAKAMAQGEPIMFDDIVRSLLATTTKVIGFLLNGTWFKKLSEEQKEIVVWQWYYNKLWDYYNAIVRKG